jgi:iron complex outermembrane receptor protein
MLAHSVAAITAMNAVGAQAAEEVEEIVVMAQRRAESIQEVPLAVSAFTSSFIRDTHLDDIKDLVKFTPGITGDSKDSFIDTLSIRGIVTNDFGVGGDPSVGVFKNNIYQGRNGEVVTTLLRRGARRTAARAARIPVRTQFDRRRHQRIHEAPGIHRPRRLRQSRPR